MYVAVTGHRTGRLGGHGEATTKRLYDLARASLMPMKREYEGSLQVLTGMAIGWDQAVAEACVSLNIPYHAYIPFYGQENRWPDDTKRKYYELLNTAATVDVVNEGGYAPWKMNRRNEAMVDVCDMVLALWDGGDGGTYNCIQYAKKHNKPVENVYDYYKRMLNVKG